LYRSAKPNTTETKIGDLNVGATFEVFDLRLNINIHVVLIN